MTPEQVKTELEQRNAERESGYCICVSEDEVIDLARGYCPKTVASLARMLIETDDDWLRRNAEKPDAPKKTRRSP